MTCPVQISKLTQKRMQTKSSKIIFKSCISWPGIPLTYSNIVSNNSREDLPAQVRLCHMHKGVILYVSSRSNTDAVHITYATKYFHRINLEITAVHIQLKNEPSRRNLHLPIHWVWGSGGRLLICTALNVDKERSFYNKTKNIQIIPSNTEQVDNLIMNLSTTYSNGCTHHTKHQDNIQYIFES